MLVLSAPLFIYLRLSINLCARIKSKVIENEQRAIAIARTCWGGGERNIYGKKFPTLSLEKSQIANAGQLGNIAGYYRTSN